MMKGVHYKENISRQEAGRSAVPGCKLMLASGKLANNGGRKWGFCPKEVDIHIFQPITVVVWWDEIQFDYIKFLEVES